MRPTGPLALPHRAAHAQGAQPARKARNAHGTRLHALARALLGTIELAALAAQPLLAQQAAQPVAASASSPTQAPATAEAGNDTPRDDSGLPLTKVTVSRQQIESGAEQEGYGEAVKSVPGSMSNNGKGSANDAIRFRGLQLGLYSNYRINGGLAITNVITIPTEDKQKVEALKGANVLMFGLASPAGILNMVTKRATDKDVTTLTLSGNTFGQFGPSVDIGRKFGDDKQFGVRVNMSQTHIETGTHGIGGTGNFFSFAGDWAISPKFVLKLDYETYRKDVVEQAGIVPPTAVKGVITVPAPPDPRQLLSGPWDVYTPRTENTIVRAEYRPSPDTFVVAEAGTSNSERSRTQARITLKNVLTGDGNENITFIKNQQYENTYRKLELQQKFHTGSLSHELTVGYSSAERDSNIPSTYSPTAANNNKAQNIYNPVEIAAPIDPMTPQTFKPNQSKDAGVYVYDNLDLGGGFKLLAGLRQTDYQFSQAIVANGPLATTTYKPLNKGLGLLWEFAPRTTAYASYMQSLEDGPIAPSGPIQGLNVTNAFAVLEPAPATQREIGVRTSYWNALYLNVDYFRIEKANTNLIQDSATSTKFVYDGDLLLQGWEVAANLQLDRHWAVNGSAQLMKSRQMGGANDGMSTENTPDRIITGNVEYKPGWTPGLTLKAGMSYVSERYIGNAQQGQIPSVTLYSVGASYQTRIAGKRTSFQLGVDNLTNVRYWSSATSSAFGAGMDRAVRFSAKTDF